MKFHRVLLFTALQMDITPVGEDLHVLLTSDGAPWIGCTAHACPPPAPEEFTDPSTDIMAGDISRPASKELSEPEITIITSDENPEKYFTIYVADRLARKTGRNVLCTGGIFVEDPDQHQLEKIYENIDEMIMDWVHFLAD